jgi:hypothetical protein
MRQDALPDIYFDLMTRLQEQIGAYSVDKIEYVLLYCVIDF